MITDRQTNFLYLSALLESMYRPFFIELEKVLNRNQIEFELLYNTNAVWCRDYMPIQVSDNKFVQFLYDPYYLQGKWKKTISNSEIVTKNIGVNSIKSDLKIEGGNVVKSEKKAILNDRIFSDNQNFEKGKLLNALTELLEVEQVIIIPKQPYDFYGHADGMIRFIDENTVVVNDYSNQSPSFQKLFKNALKSNKLEYVEMPYEITNDKNSEDDYTAKGTYINFLQIAETIILPVFNLKEDEAAFKKVSEIFPKYKIETINCNDIAEDGGVLNCISWNILKTNSEASKTVRPQNITSELGPKGIIKELKQSDLPSAYDWPQIIKFAITFNGIDYCRSELKLVELVGDTETYFWNSGSFKDYTGIDELRAVLFGFTHKKEFTALNSPNYQDMQFLKAIISKLNKLLYEKIWEIE